MITDPKPGDLVWTCVTPYSYSNGDGLEPPWRVEVTAASPGFWYDDVPYPAHVKGKHLIGGDVSFSRDAVAFHDTEQEALIAWIDALGVRISRAEKYRRRAEKQQRAAYDRLLATNSRRAIA